MNKDDFNKCKLCGKEIFNLEQKKIVCTECVPVASNLSMIENFNNVMLDHILKILPKGADGKQVFDTYLKILGCCCFYSDMIMGTAPRETMGRSTECADEFIKRFKKESKDETN